MNALKFSFGYFRLWASTRLSPDFDLWKWTGEALKMSASPRDLERVSLAWHLWHKMTDLETLEQVRGILHKA